ncbi:hypothetical protein QFZ22_008520 [Streptomyces canus]|uniref:MalT-like TPR region domain-containing protein n=1 Tax=Streptomyces canus TaxID=58343 RepID=A0AAW8FU16_9ACTN|nr:hypothetical protein [Streptomyces canus]
MDDRLAAQLRMTRARALRAEEDLEAATAEFAALAAESAGWDDDPGSHAMIAAETAVLLGGSGEFGPAREAADQAIAAHARDPRYELLSNSPARTRPPPGPAARAPRVWPTPSPSSPTPTGSPTRPALVRAGVGVDALCS